jgi:phosphatidylserine/phosphatidylglycerophosphate/cardiolipin synthase-like enzyme
MPSVTAQFLEQGGAAISGFPVRVWQFDHSYGAFPLQSGQTGADGRVSVNVPPFGIPSPNDFRQLRLTTTFGREIWRSAPFLVSLADENLGTVTIPSADMRGLLVTNLSGAVQRLEAGNAVMPLVDNAVAWAEIETSVAAANDNILLQLFYFDVGLGFLRFAPDPPALNTRTTGIRLEDLLLTANRRTPAIPIRLLIRDATPLGYPTDTALEVQAFFQTNQPNTVGVRLYPTDVRLPMHAKVIIVDDATGFVIGSPFLQEYFDAKTHLIDDRRRGLMSSLGANGFPGGLKNSVRVPIHDVSCRIRGPAVTHLRETFYDHWDRVGPAEGNTLPAPSGPTPHTSIQIVRSLPGGTFSGLPDGEKGVLEAYLRVFETATQYVYLENQYFLSHDICEGIRLALRNRPGLEFILLINNKVDLPGYFILQPAAIQRLITGLTADGTLDRFAMFCLWMSEPGARQRVIRTYVHSKVGIADDNWATIGSANLDGVSMNTSEANLPPVLLTDEHNRATEVNAVFFDGVAGQPGSSVPRDLRRELWAEHLGLSASDPQLVTRPSGGWRSLWRNVANSNIAALNANPPQLMPGRVLPFHSEPKPDNFLRASGVDPRRFDVRTEVPSFDFNTGRPVP